MPDDPPRPVTRLRTCCQMVKIDGPGETRFDQDYGRHTLTAITGVFSKAELVPLTLPLLQQLSFLWILTSFCATAAAVTPPRMARSRLLTSCPPTSQSRVMSRSRMWILGNCSTQESGGCEHRGSSLPSLDNCRAPETNSSFIANSSFLKEWICPLPWRRPQRRLRRLPCGVSPWRTCSPCRSSR